MLGTVGGENRMESTVISDAVNVAARMETLSKLLGARIVITQHTLDQLEDPQAYSMRQLGTFAIKSRSRSGQVYEVFDGDPPKCKAKKTKSTPEFNGAVQLFQAEKYQQALPIFQKILAEHPNDQPASYFLERCQEALS
jgi:TolA-binding protein